MPNNAQYKILKVCAGQLELPRAAQGEYESLDVVEPEVDLVGLARSLGVDACSVGEPDELSDRLPAALASDKPLLINVPIARDSAKRLNYG